MDRLVTPPILIGIVRTCAGKILKNTWHTQNKNRKRRLVLVHAIGIRQRMEEARALLAYVIPNGTDQPRVKFIRCEEQCEFLHELRRLAISQEDQFPPKRCTPPSEMITLIRELRHIERKYQKTSKTPEWTELYKCCNICDRGMLLPKEQTDKPFRQDLSIHQILSLLGFGNMFDEVLKECTRLTCSTWDIEAAGLTDDENVVREDQHSATS